MITAMIDSLSLNEKVLLNQQLAAAIAAEVTGLKSAPIAAAPAAGSKKASKAKKEKDPNAPKKAAAPGVLAWNAFVKHCKTTQPTLFEGIKKEAERLAICGGIKEKDVAAYEAWVKNWLATVPASSAASVASPPPSPVIAPIVAPVADVPVVPATVPAKKPSKAKAAAEAKAAEAARLAAEAAAKLAEATDDEDEGMVKKTINGKNYLMDPESQDLFSTCNKFEEVGDFIGKLAASGEIDFTAEQG